MLTNRLAGTTEASASYRGGHDQSGEVNPPALTSGERGAQSSLALASPKSGSTLLTRDDA
jgi:hypothetical protein